MDKFKDVVMFGKIISTGFLIGGYVFLGVYLARRLVASGYPSWINAALPAALALFGLGQGWFLVREIMRKK
ncbi:hypothetical protein C8D99_11830 [Aminivibrio pyruvatiphilus]|uniref:Uncharacterized protein n=2 Tax=Aminivibrio pyruvatiphilus TaxID=1005740 RepID=A0A4R8M5N7_9BACT|nr:hypothetical protein C8D99_11830 [Aminivibrio pyruvatiphilus]